MAVPLYAFMDDAASLLVFFSQLLQSRSLPETNVAQ